MPDTGPALRTFCLPEQNTQPLEERQTVCQHGCQESGHQRPASGPRYTLILAYNPIQNNSALITLSCYVTADLSFAEFRQAGLSLPEGTAPMPRDMCFPVPKGSSWHQLYDYIRYTTHTFLCDNKVFIINPFFVQRLLLSYSGYKRCSYHFLTLKVATFPKEKPETP